SRSRRATRRDRDPAASSGAGIAMTTAERLRTVRQAPATLIERLAAALESAGIAYCQWKGHSKRNRWLTGAGDLDLLVDPAAWPALVEVLVQLGFKRAVAPLAAAACRGQLFGLRAGGRAAGPRARLSSDRDRPPVAHDLQRAARGNGARRSEPEFRGARARARARAAAHGAPGGATLHRAGHRAAGPLGLDRGAATGVAATRAPRRVVRAGGDDRAGPALRFGASVRALSRRLPVRRVALAPLRADPRAHVGAAAVRAPARP